MVKVEVDTVDPSIIAVEMTDNTTVTIQFNEPVFANANQSTITTAKFRFTTQTGSITVNSPTPSAIEFADENKIKLGVDITGSTNGTQTSDQYPRTSIRCRRNSLLIKHPDRCL